MFVFDLFCLYSKPALASAITPNMEMNDIDIARGLNCAKPDISCRSITPTIINPNTDIKNSRIEKHTRQGG